METGTSTLDLVFSGEPERRLETFFRRCHVGNHGLFSNEENIKPSLTLAQGTPRAPCTPRYGLCVHMLVLGYESVPGRGPASEAG